MSKIENFHESYIRNHWVRATVNEFLHILPVYVKGEKLVYLKATLELVSNDPEGFWINGFSFYHIQFYDHKMKGKKCVSVKAKYDKVCEHIREIREQNHA